MSRSTRLTWLLVFLACHTVGIAIEIVAATEHDWVGIVIGGVITVVSVFIIFSLVDQEEVALSSNRKELNHIPSELKQAIVNADVDFIDEALRSREPAQMAIALEHAKALFRTLLSMAKGLLS